MWAAAAVGTHILDELLQVCPGDGHRRRLEREELVENLVQQLVRRVSQVAHVHDASLLQRRQSSYLHLELQRVDAALAPVAAHALLEPRTHLAHLLDHHLKARWHKCQR